MMYWNLVAAAMFYLVAVAAIGQGSGWSTVGIWFGLGAAFTAQALRHVRRVSRGSPAPGGGPRSE
jgi:hypothetical protein